MSLKQRFYSHKTKFFNKSELHTKAKCYWHEGLKVKHNNIIMKVHNRDSLHDPCYKKPEIIKRM